MAATDVEVFVEMMLSASFDVVVLLRVALEEGEDELADAFEDEIELELEVRVEVEV